MVKKKQTDKGFTLIEMMVVIAIIGILVSVAIPLYHTHVIRARVMEGLTLASSAKLAVAEAVVSNSGMPAGHIAKGYVGPKPTENVASIVLDHEDGDITITYTPKAGDGTIVLTPIVQPTGEITWACKEGTLPAKYRPAACQ